MKVFLGILLAAALALAVFLRFFHLGVAPFHADEAVQAFIFKDFLEAGQYHYDPHHYHGPLPHYINKAWTTVGGYKTLRDLSEESFRILPAIAGCVLVIAIALAAWSTGNLTAAAVAGLFAAASPLLVFFSRFGLHEMLFSLCGFLASWAGIALLRNPTWSYGALFGALTALTAACKETWIFLAFAWLIATAVVLATHRCPLIPPRKFAFSLTVAAAVFLALIFVLFWNQFGDFWRSYFIYETNSGHNKPFPYYFLELFPQGSRWCGEPWFWLAAICLAGWLGWGRKHAKFPLTVEFLGLTGLVTLVIFSFIPYKTPWLMVLPMALCLPAAAWLCVQHGRSRPSGILMAAVMTVIFVWQIRCTWIVSQKRFWDSKIPLVYSPTSLTAPKLREYLLKTCPGKPIAVIGRDYWPLPWYLRDFPQVGYFDEPRERGDFAAFIFCGEHLDKRVSVPVEEALWGVRVDYLVRTLVFTPPK